MLAHAQTRLTRFRLSSVFLDIATFNNGVMARAAKFFRILSATASTKSASARPGRVK